MERVGNLIRELGYTLLILLCIGLLCAQLILQIKAQIQTKPAIEPSVNNPVSMQSYSTL